MANTRSPGGGSGNRPAWWFRGTLMTYAETESLRPDPGRRYADKSVCSLDASRSAKSARHDARKQGQVPELRRGGTSAGQRHSDLPDFPGWMDSQSMNVGPYTVFQMPPRSQHVDRTADKERRGCGVKLLFLYRVSARIEGVNQANSASPTWYLRATMSAGQSACFLATVLHRHGAPHYYGAQFIKRGMNHYNWVTRLNRWVHGRNSRHLELQWSRHERRNHHGRGSGIAGMCTAQTV